MDSHAPEGPTPTTTTTTAAPRPRARKRAAWAGLAVASLAVGAGVGVHATTTSSTTATSPVAAGSQWSDTGWSRTSRGGWSGGWGGFGGGNSAGLGTSTGDGATGATAEATAVQEKGVVDIDVVLGGNEEAAGTGMLLTPTGQILTNRHVVLGERRITVTVPSTGRSYGARVVGISTTTDVAVVQLVNASGLETVTTSSHAVEVDDPVVGVGNAGGTGGTPSAALGVVTDLDRTITASDTDGSNPERLTGLIETDAPIRPGDSGGPLLDTANEVVGMDTAGSPRGGEAYAIPIATALSVAKQIVARGPGTKAGTGSTSGQAQRGYLGVQVEDGTGGAMVAGVLTGSPAEGAGIAVGDTITAVAGRRVGSAQELGAAMATVTPGHPVTVTWTDAGGASHSATVTPVAG